MRRTLTAAVVRRQKEVVTPALFEMAISGNADGIYSILEDGDSVNPQVLFWSYTSVNTDEQFCIT